MDVQETEKLWDAERNEQMMLEKEKMEVGKVKPWVLKPGKPKVGNASVKAGLQKFLHSDVSNREIRVMSGVKETEKKRGKRATPWRWESGDEVNVLIEICRHDQLCPAKRLRLGQEVQEWQLMQERVRELVWSKEKERALRKREKQVSVADRGGFGYCAAGQGLEKCEMEGPEVCLDLVSVVGSAQRPMGLEMKWFQLILQRRALKIGKEILLAEEWKREAAARLAEKKESVQESGGLRSSEKWEDSFQWEQFSPVLDTRARCRIDEDEWQGVA